MGKILYINPVGTDVFDKPMKEYLEQYKNPDNVLHVTSLSKGPKHLEYYSYDAIVIPQILKEVRKAEKEGYDACIIGCFYDPGLKEAREVGNIIVTAPLESSTTLALSLGEKFAIIVGRKKWIPLMMNRVKEYGLVDRLTSFKDVGLGVYDLHKDEKDTERRLYKAVEESIQEGAEVIILGCTVFFGFYKVVQEKYKIPVIDPIIASLKHAELLVEAKKLCGWSHSKICSYESPPTSEILSWNLEEII
ncbi:MAG: aspartate/glutamate racemase family protein [Aigarchaeota archaeon]|nr:aspartate/glutamate racemase family protein [Aigarchaeota archaeon]